MSAALCQSVRTYFFFFYNLRRITSFDRNSSIDSKRYNEFTEEILLFYHKLSINFDNYIN